MNLKKDPCYNVTLFRTFLYHDISVLYMGKKSGGYDISRGSYNPDLMPQGFEKELERLRLQATYFWSKERKKLEYFGLKDGMRVLEIGMGPGYVTEQLLKDYPNLEIVGIDINSRFVDLAKKRFKHDPRVTFVEGSVYSMPFEKEEFDFVYVRLVFQHLKEPLDALNEIYRVLRKKGKLVVLDIDEELLGIIDPDYMNWRKYNNQVSKTQSKRGGDRRVGRKLIALFKEAGFRNVELEAILAHSDELGIENFLAQAWNEEDIDWAIKNSVISKEEGEKQKALYRLFLATPHKIIITLVFVCGGEKPLYHNPLINK